MKDRTRHNSHSSGTRFAMCLGMVCILSIDCHLKKCKEISVQNPLSAQSNWKDLEGNPCRDKEMTIALRRHDNPLS
jgi:hypothetical protein